MKVFFDENLGNVDQGAGVEQWTPLEGYQGYSISNLGRIRNDRRDSLIAVTTTETHHSYVSLVRNHKQVNRSLALLVAQTFIPNDNPEHFTTPIHLDGDLSNCHAGNLLWRPRWFAMRFTQQFRLDLPHTPWPIRELKTGEEFENPWPPVSIFGLLFNDIVLSIEQRTRVFPTWQAFERIE